MVHLPNMEDEPRETFEDPVKLFGLLGVCIGASREEPAVSDHLSSPPDSTPSPKSTPPPASRASEKRTSYDTSLSYEERAALRRAEREERRRREKH